MKKIIIDFKNIYRFLKEKLKLHFSLRAFLAIEYPKSWLLFGNLFRTNYIPVLTFHWFVTEEQKRIVPKYRDSIWYSSIEDFKIQLQWLTNHKYTFITPDDLYQWMIGSKQLKRKSVLLTFDDGEESQLSMVAPLLKKYGIPGLCFTVGNRLMNRKENIPSSAVEDNIYCFSIEQLELARHDYPSFVFGSHTYNLHYKIQDLPAIYAVDDSVIDSDFRKMDQLNFEYFSAPYGAYNSCVYDNIGKRYKLGFATRKIDCPYAFRKGDRFEIGRISILGNTQLSDLMKYL